MHHPIDRRRGRHRVFEDLVPFREHEVRGDYVELERFVRWTLFTAPAFSFVRCGCRFQALE